MRGQDLLTSIAIHGAVFGAVVVADLPQTVPECDSRSVPIYFEVVEEAIPAASTQDATDAELIPTTDPGPLLTPDEQQGVEPEEKSIEVEEGYVPDAPAEEHAPTADETEETQTEVDEEQVAMAQVTAPEKQMETVLETTAQEERARVVSDPMALNRIVPVYPRSARRKGHEGSVTIEIEIAEDGGIVRADVVASSGHAELDAAAVAAMRTAHFAPATEDGVSVRGQLRMTFDFRLK